MNLGDSEIRTRNLLFTKQPLSQLELYRQMWPGREADAPLRTPRSRQSPFCRDESRPHKFGAQGRTQTFTLWFVGPALHQLSYSGEKVVVGVGIEPTFRVFQTRANPSQLSDRLERAVRLELTILDLQSSALATWRRAQIGTEGEVRTLETSLEDSHVSSYITSAWDANQGDPRLFWWGENFCKRNWSIVPDSNRCLSIGNAVS